MEIKPEITFQKLPYSESVDAAIQRWIARLEHVYERIASCRVSVLYRRHRTGKAFEIHISLGVPGTEITSSHVQSDDIYLAVADAFRAVRRQLIEYAHAQSGHG